VATEPDAGLRVAGLDAGYGGVPVVRDLDLEVAPGEVVALLGANGAGKTTTLTTIAGLRPPLAGEIRFGGEPIGGLPAHRLARRGISLVPEGRALFAELTVEEHLRLAGAGRASLAREQLFELFPELEKCAGRRAGVLSGGEQQMLAVGRGIVSRPGLLLVDEMSLGLAPVVVERMLPVLRRVADEIGAGVLFVEQHVAIALEVADRGYVLKDGRVVLAGTAAELSGRGELLRSSYLGDQPTVSVS
jgi:branched-chain amino acid transport system ATP-binding protein